MQQPLITQLQQLFQQKKILLWGAGKEGLSTYRFFRRHFPTMPLWIADQAMVDQSNFQFVTWIPSSNWCEEFNQFDIIFKSPGIPLLDPAIDRSKITSQTALFLKFFQKQTIGITGTKGKSTTASLLFHILHHNHKPAILLGNIGIPCLDHFDKITSDQIVIFELSCHQLEDLQYSPHIAVFLNLHEDHLDHYGDYASYVQAKSNIFLHQQPEDILIINQQQRSLTSHPHPLLCSLDQPVDLFTTPDGVVVMQEFLSLDQQTTLVGRHNYYNIGVVYYIASSLLGVSKTAFLKTLKIFTGLKHRLQRVGTFNRITYYDDSISTVCETTIQALKSIKQVDTLILGGLNRGIQYQPLTDYLFTSTVSTIILLPNTDQVIFPLLKNCVNKKVILANNLSEAVAAAKNYTPLDGICLLSPAAASYNQFSNFEQRGNQFQALVQER